MNKRDSSRVRVDRMPDKAPGTAEMRPDLIAACGMNCSLCYAHIREKKACPGCRGDDRLKPGYCTRCVIRNCGERAKTGAGYCFTCGRFPCDRLKQLDKRYRTKYGMSMIENLDSIGKSGIRAFVRREKERWACPKCGKTICVHKPECLSCGHAWR